MPVNSKIEFLFSMIHNTTCLELIFGTKKDIAKVTY